MKYKIYFTLALLFAALQTFAQSTAKYKYDENNRLTQVTYSNGVTVSYTYDALGNRLSKTVTGASQKKSADVNSDGKVNGTDIQAVINVIVDEDYVEKADVNKDNKVNGTDIQEIINIIVEEE